MDEKQKAIVALVVAAMIGGGVSPVLVRVGVQYFHPFMFNFLRSFAVVLMLLPVIVQNKQLFNQRRFFISALIFGSLLGGNALFFSFGIPLTTIIASQLLFALLPLTVPALAAIWLKERVSSRQVIGISIALIGVLIIIFSSRSLEVRLSLGSFVGNVWILLAVLFYTIYVVFSRKMGKSLSPWVILFATYFGSILFFLPFAGFDLMAGTGFSLLDWRGVAAVMGLAGSSLFFMYLVQYGLRRVSATTMSVTTLLGPEFGALSGVLLYQEQLSITLVLSMCFVLLGVVISVSGERKTFWEKVSEKLSHLRRRFAL